MRFGFLKNNKGFSLIECIISIAIFALMSLIVFQILSNALRQRQVNNDAVEKKNEQIADNVSGGNIPDGTNPITITFYDSAGNPVGEIEGGLSQYDNSDNIFSITKPELDISDYEYGLLVDNGHQLAIGRSFYSSLPLTDVKVRETTPDVDVMVWELSFKYTLAVGEGFITYFKIPGRAVTEITTDGRALTRLFSNAGITYVRIRALSASPVVTPAETVVRVTMDMSGVPYGGLKKWFDPYLDGGGALIELVQDGANPNNYIPS